MIYNFYNRYKKLAVFLILFLIVSPLTLLVIKSISGGNPSLILPVGRRLNLLIHTLSWGLSVSVGCVIMALPAALFLWRKQKWGNYRWLVFSGFLIPPYIHVTAWQILISWFKQLSGQKAFAVTGWGISWWVQSIYLMPLAVGVLLILLEMIDRDELEAAHILATSKIVWRKIILPKLMTGIALTGSIIFILAIIDYTIPSLFAVNTYALEIMAEFNASYSIANAMMIALPLVVILLFGIVMIARFMPRQITGEAFKPASELRVKFGPLSKTLQMLTFIIMVVLLMLPLLSILGKAEVVKMLPVVIGENGGQLLDTFMICFTATVVIGIIGVATALSLQNSKKKHWWWVAIFLPLVIPPSLIGMALINLSQSLLPRAISSSMVMPIWALIIRFSSISIAVISLGLQQIPRKELESGLLLSAPSYTMLKILLPRLRPVITTSMLLVFILCLGDLGATLLVVPPGVTTITITIYNYLHYGASVKVAALCLLIMLMIMGIAGVIFWARRQRKNNDDRN